MIIKSNLIDIKNRTIFPAQVTVDNGKIASILQTDESYNTFILPGFVDAHIHIESSMLIPREFARHAVKHGTIATISDPHEIGNVLGVAGVEYMLKDAETVPFKFHFGAPSCVPATYFESAGAVITVEDIKYLLGRKDIYYLAEMMNWPGVLYDDKEVYAKIKVAHDLGKPVDGHAPGLKGEQAEKYIKAGISTDHECFSREEALDKLKFGMKILIREGSAAKNYEALWQLVDEYPEMTMFCSDDKHPDDLLVGHINLLVKRSLEKGLDLFNVLKTACINPVEHYKMNVGLLRVGDFADFIEIDNLNSFNVLKTFINGELVAEKGVSKIQYSKGEQVNNFNIHKIKLSELFVEPKGLKINVIEALDGELITKQFVANAKIENGNTVSDIENDILKLVVVNRYTQAPVAKAFIHNFGIKKGAIASSVGHDCHNIIAVGADDKSILECVNSLIECKGGISVFDGEKIEVLPLPIAGIMTDESGENIGKLYQSLDKKAKELGSKLKAPYMLLSFMALLVIPSLKLSDKGLFDGDKFEFKDLFV